MTCLEGDPRRYDQQTKNRGDPLGFNGTKQTHEVVTGQLKMALFAVNEVGAVEMIGEVNRETAGSSTGNPKHM